MKKFILFIISNIPEIIIVSGFGCAIYGTWEIYQPAAFILAGALLMLGGSHLARK